ncbi:alpha/beta hydrolase [Microbacterium aurum]
MSVDAADPGRGDVGGITAAASLRASRATALRTAHDQVTAAIAEASPEAWTGQSREAFIVGATALAAELSTLAGQADAEASALSTYAQGVQSIKDEQARLELRRADATADLALYKRQKRTADIEATTDMAIGASTDAQERSATYADWIAQSETDLAAVDAAWQNLVSDRESVNRACVAALTAGDVQGALAPSRLRGANTGDALLDRLSVTDLAVLARTDPDLAAKLRSADPVKVRDWWAGLGEGERTVLIQAMPSIIGNLEGVAYSDRDTANRMWLTQQITQIEDDIDAGRFGATASSYGGAGGYQNEAAVAEMLERLRGLKGIQNALAPGRQLISLTGGSPPLDAIAIGDMDTAQNVTYAVPGMGSSAEGMGDWVESARNVSAAQGRMAPGQTHAVVAWIGYEAPPVGPFGVLGTDFAREGAPHLGTALRGFEATRPDAQLNVLAHSYGTTTASIALTEPGVHVDSFVSIGSAGLTPSIDEASDVHADQVFAGQANGVWAIDPAPGDKWAWFGRAFSDHPVNPVGDDFGAKTFGVDTGKGGTSVTDHGVSTPDGTGYLDPGTESLRNVALATTGRGDEVTPRLDHEPTLFQQAIINASQSGY